MSASLVGSEMCIRDSPIIVSPDARVRRHGPCSMMRCMCRACTSCLPFATRCPAALFLPVVFGCVRSVAVRLQSSCIRHK
eukprot:9346726-Alexandrium_andersonii.AAC.1